MLLNCSTNLVFAFVSMFAEDNLVTISRALDAQRSGIKSLSCKYSISSVASDYYLSLRAKLANTSVDNMKEKFNTHALVSFEETKTGFFKADTTYKKSRISVGRRQVYSWDGSENWKLAYVHTQNDEELVPDIEIKRDVRPSYEAEVVGRRFLGFTLLPHADKLPNQFISYSDLVASASNIELLPLKPVVDSECVGLRWTTTAGDNKKRETLWLDPQRGLAIRQYTEEALLAGMVEWATMTGWTCTKWKQVQRSDEAKTVKEFWFPAEVDQFSNDTKGHRYFDRHITVSNLEFNNLHSNAQFTPRIEDGSNIFDTQKGTSIVYGGGPSPRLLAILARRVEETKAKLKPFELPEESSVANPSSGFELYGPWITCILGTVGLSTAAVTVLRQRSNRRNAS